MLRVSRAETDSARLPHLPNHSIAVISKDIHLIVPSEGVGLQVVMFPIPKDKSDVVQVTADSLEVRYSDEMGYEIHDAIKSAIKHVKLSMTSSDDAVEACQQIAVAQTQLSDEVGSMLAQVEDGTPAPKRSIAMINLWTSGDEVTPSTKAIPAREDHLNGSETQKASPLYRLSQKTKDCAEQENSHKLKQNDSGHDQAGEDPESESSFLDEVPAPSKFRDRLRASQERSNELVTSEAFNRRVDRAINKVGTSPVKSNALLEVATKRQSHLPANEDQSTTRMPAAQPQSNSAAVALGLLDGRNQRKATVRVSPVPTILSTSPKPSESTQGLPSRAHAPLDATKKDVRGPMARLASSQAKGLPPSSKKDSDSASSLKRKGRPSGKKDPEDTIDWDEGLRDDDSDEEPIKKKTKAGKTNASTKSTKTKKTQGKKTAAATKTTAAKSRKMVTDSQQASVQETATSKRERRNVKSARYVEDSGSASDEPVEEIVEPTNKGTPSGSLKKPETQDKLSTQGQSNESRSDRAVPAQHRTTPASQTAPNPVAKVCSAQASTGDVVKSSGKEGRMSLVPAVVIASSPATSRRGKVTVVASVIQSAQTNLNGQDTAQDSYPMTTEAKDGRIAAPGISFDTKLLELVGPNDDKENMPPPSASPFGSKKQFIANVNSTRSGSQEELLTAPFPSKAKTGSFVASSKPLHKKRPIPGSDKTNAHTNQPPSAADHYRQTVNQTDPLALGDLVRDDAEPVDDTVDPELRLDKPSNDPSFGPRIDDQPIGLQTGRMARTIAGFDAAKPFEEAKATKTPRRPSKPRRQNSSPLTSEKSSQKPSVVHFSAAGPLNQGTSSVNRQKTSTSIIRAPGETSRHSRFKQQTAEYQASEDTPSRPPPTKTYHVTNATSKVLDKDSSLVNPDYVSVVEDTEVALDTADAHNDAKRLQGPVQVAPARPDPQMSRHSGQRDKPLESQRKSDARSDASMSPRTQADNAAARSPADATSSTHRYATSRPRETPREFPPTVHMSKGPSTVEISDIEMGRAARSLPRDPLQVAEHTQSNDLSATELLQHEVDTFMAVVRDSGSQSTSPPPSPETEEEEPSEYEEPESAEVSVEREDRSLLPTKAKSQSSISPTTPQLDDTRPQIPQHRGPDIIRPSSKRQHGSIGLSDLIQKRFPQGRTSIDTTIFRDQPPGDDDRSAGTTTRNKRVKLAVGGTEDTELKVKRATVVDATSLAGITRSSLEHMDSGMPKHEMTMAMPPPRRKSGPVTKSQTISHERTRSSMPGTIIARHRVCDDNAGEIETTSGLLPLRVTQSAARTPQLPEATQLPESTPVPFHERIGAHKTETEHGDRLEPARVQLNSRRKTNSFLSQDAADRTLINEADIPGYSFYYRPDLRAREEREMTERTEDSETPAREYVNATKDETRSWSSAGRQIRDLGTEFNSIYNVSNPLFPCHPS